MANQLIARGQVSIVVQKDAYTITQSAGQYIFSANEHGVIQHTTSIESVVSVMRGDRPCTDFSIGSVTPPAGFTSIEVDNLRHTITYNIVAGTENLPDDGCLTIPVIIEGRSYELSFAWSKSLRGVPGTAGSQLDWVADWDTNKTTIDAQTLITPKIFTGIRHTDGTLTGSALGHFALKSVAADGAVVTETIDGIYGFCRGLRTFALENNGNVTLGRGDQSVHYDAATGRIVFGSGVSLAWTSAIATAKGEAIESASVTAQSKADAALGAACSYADTKKTEAVTEAGTAADEKIGTLTMTLNAAIADAKKAGTDARTVADAITSKANSEGWSTKLTYIDGNGIFTGTLSAGTVNAIRINASQLVAGTIATDRLDAASIRADIINAGYISGLDCTFSKGTIGGWTIGAATISGDHICLDSGNKRIAVYDSGSSPISGRRAQLHYVSDSNFGFYVTNAAGVRVASLGSENIIAGWVFDHQRIWKNNVSLGADGSIANAAKWQLNNDGSGLLASGNIAWDTAGNVTFGASVSLNWTQAATNALGEAKAYADTKKTEAISAAATDATTKSDAAKELAQAMAFGKMLYRDPTFYNGNNNVKVYNNSGGTEVTITRVANALAPNDSKQVLEIRTTGTTSPGCGGFYFANMCGYKKVFICRIIAKIPEGWALMFATNSMGTGSSSKWLTPQHGAGQWCEYMYKVACGTDNFSTTNFYYLVGLPGTVDAPLVWQLAYATVFDVTSAEKYTTTIDANGIYTGTLTAVQVNAVDINASSIKTGILSVDRLGAGSIKAEKLDAASIKANIINTDYINGLSCSFVRGTIGGWTITGDSITAGTIAGVGATPIQLRPTSTGSGYWYAGQYRPMGMSVNWYQSNNAGHIVFGQVAASGNAPRTGFVGIQMMSWDSTEYFCLSANYTLSGSKEVYNRIAGWGFDNASIWKNNVVLGSDGSITNGSRWRLGNDGAASFGSGKVAFNTDGSGQVANGKLSWDAAGNLTAVGGFFKDMTIQGTVRSAFVLNDPSIWIGGSDASQQDPRHYDNVVTIQTGGWNENINLPWTLDQSGRRVCLVNYRWGSTISDGYMSITAPMGKYFYEDGISKNTLSFSREVIELLGYGDNSTFYGWIVLNRRDMMTSGKYGNFQQILASGTVIGASWGISSFTYHTFDGSPMSASRLDLGVYRVYLPYAWNLEAKYMVMMTGRYTDTMIYPTLYGQYSYYWDTWTQDDASRNEGAFNFQVFSTYNWDH